MAALTHLRVLLLHSPLVGPATLRPTADELGRLGADVTLPDLTGVLADPRPSWFVDAAVAAAPEVDVVVAHSGAGAMLPTVSSRVGARAAVFVDAVLPQPEAQQHVTDDRQRDALDAHTADDGLLRPWTTWWPPELLARLLPDEEVRAIVAGECGRLPRSFYDRPVELPRHWVPCAYVALGGAYADELGRAGDLGWPCSHLGLHHLATVTDPVGVAAAVADVVARLDPAGGTADEPARLG